EQADAVAFLACVLAHLHSSARSLIGGEADTAWAGGRRRSANDRAVRVAVLFENLQFLQPSHEGMCCGVGLLTALRLLDPVQDFIALVDSRSSLLLARKARCIVEIADDPAILEVQLRREIKLNRHAAETPGCAGGSCGNQCD